MPHNCCIGESSGKDLAHYRSAREQQEALLTHENKIGRVPQTSSHGVRTLARMQATCLCKVNALTISGHDNFPH